MIPCMSVCPHPTAAAAGPSSASPELQDLRRKAELLSGEPSLPRRANALAPLVLVLVPLPLPLPSALVASGELL